MQLFAHVDWRVPNVKMRFDRASAPNGDRSSLHSPPFGPDGMFYVRRQAQFFISFAQPTQLKFSPRAAKANVTGSPTALFRIGIHNKAHESLSDEALDGLRQTITGRSKVHVRMRVRCAVLAATMIHIDV